jgi:hypothetical protein
VSNKTRRKGQQRKAPAYSYTYTIMDELMASTTQPMPVAKQLYQIDRMRQALQNIETAPAPTPTDWRICSDAVNLMETLLTHGDVLQDGKPIPGCWLDCDGEPVQLSDHQGLLADAIEAMAMAGRRKFSHGTIRLDGRGLVAVRGLIDDYASLLAHLPERTAKQVHRLTERRVQDILRGKSKPHDIEIINL